MSTTSPIYGRTRDGMLVARVGDQVFAMRPHESGFHLVRACGLTGTMDDWTVADFHDNRRDPVDETEFRRTVEEAPSASANSQPIWACRPTFCVWPPKARSAPMRRSPPRPGSPTNVAGPPHPLPRSIRRPHRCRCPPSNDRKGRKPFISEIRPVRGANRPFAVWLDGPCPSRFVPVCGLASPGDGRSQRQAVLHCRFGPPAMIELSTGMPAGAPPPASASSTAVTNREGRGSQG